MTETNVPLHHRPHNMVFTLRLRHTLVLQQTMPLVYSPVFELARHMNGGDGFSSRWGTDQNAAPENRPALLVRA